MPCQRFHDALALRRGPRAVQRGPGRWRHSLDDLAGKNVGDANLSTIGEAQGANQTVAQLPDVSGPIVNPHCCERFGFDRQRRHAEFRRSVDEQRFDQRLDIGLPLTQRRDGDLNDGDTITRSGVSRSRNCAAEK
jgi:hypothetical protein